MWAIKVLNGANAGQIFILKEGRNRLGRSDSADLTVHDASISKEHLEITVVAEKVVFADLNSANGTFLNGLRVKGGDLKFGDKFGAGEILFDVIHAQAKSVEPLQSKALVKRKSQTPRRRPSRRIAAPPVPRELIPKPMALANANNHSDLPHPMAASDFRSMSEKFDHYVDGNLLPPLYQATEAIEFKTVLMGVLFAYVVAITLLAMVPMKQITSDSITEESRRRAKTVARSLASGNQKFVRSGELGSFSTDFAIKEEGVDDAYVIGKDGHLLAPADRVGSVPKEAGFFHDKIFTASNPELTQEFDGKVVSATPIMGYDADLQQNVARAYAVVIYNPGSLSFNEGRLFSLFIQTLILALVVGGFIYFVLYRLIQFPFVKLAQELDAAMRSNSDHLGIEIKLPVLQNLLTSINSLLARSKAQSSAGGTEAAVGARNHEYSNIVDLMGYPSMLLSRDGTVLRCNSNFEALLNLNLADVLQRRYDDIPDNTGSVHKMLEYLMNSSRASTSQIATDTSEIGGRMFNFCCQAMTTASGEVDCFFISIKPVEGAEGNVA